MKKLMSMVETVPENPYSKFIQQTPTLGMFVPCDENGNVLEKPIFNGDHDLLEYKHQQFVEAEQRVIFQGWELAKKEEGSIKIVNKEKEKIWFFYDGDIEYQSKLIKTIEDLVPYNLILK